MHFTLPPPAGLRDPEVLVRGAAAICLAQLAEFMPDRLVDRHETIMPAAIALLGDPDNGVKERGCYGEQGTAFWRKYTLCITGVCFTLFVRKLRVRFAREEYTSGSSSSLMARNTRER